MGNPTPASLPPAPPCNASDGTQFMNVIEKASPVEQITIESYSQDVADHQQTFDAFVRLLAIAALHVVTCVVALAIGGVEHDWTLTAVLVVAATAAAAFGAASRFAWKPGAGVLAAAIVCLALMG
jgi:hypothetical protein